LTPPHHVDAASVGGQVATDLAGVLGGQRQREQAVGVLGGTAQVAENAASLDHHCVGDRVDRADLVHAIEAEHDVGLVAVRSGAATQAGIATARHHGHTSLLAQRQRLRHLFGCARTDYRLRLALVEATPVGEPGCHVVGCGGHDVGAQGFGQALREVRIGHDLRSGKGGDK